LSGLFFIFLNWIFTPYSQQKVQKNGSTSACGECGGRPDWSSIERFWEATEYSDEQLLIFSQNNTNCEWAEKKKDHGKARFSDNDTL